jgi:hypothetical protein
MAGSDAVDFRKVKLTSYEKKRYVMPESRDFEILFKIKALEKKRPCQEDKRMIKLIRTQLEKDWRKPLIRELGRLGKKYP